MSSEKNFFRRWLDGQVDWSAMLEQEKPAPKAVAQRKLSEDEIRRMKQMEEYNKNRRGC